MKNNLLSMLTILAFLFSYSYTFGQSAYIRIVDKSFIPIMNDKGVFKHVSIENKDFQKLVDKCHFSKFELGFPNTDLEWFQNIYYIEMETDNELAMFISEIKQHFPTQIPYIDVIEEVIPDAEAFYPNDSLYVIGNLSHLDYVRVPEAWNIAKHYGKVKVGITDWYFHEAHPDLDFETIIGPNIYDTIYYDHGTIVSGFIGGKTNNQIGVASAGGFNTTLVASNKKSKTDIRYLAASGCKVINCSWHSSSFNYNNNMALFYDSILNYYDCLVIASAGNDIEHGGGSLSRKVYPASYPSCLSVTSVGYMYDYGDSGNHNWKDVHCLDVNDTTTSHHHNTAVDVCAPGYEMQSTNYWQNQAGYTIHNCTGTSFAAPIVTGIAAMVRAVNPNLTAAQTMQIIKETADASIYDIPENAPYIGKLGTGRVDAYAAVRKACAVDVENETYTSDETLEGCIVTLKNVNVQNSANLVIDAVVEAELISNVEIPLGCSLEIR